MLVLETERLNLRWLDSRDAAFILGLTNEPSWLKYIGDKGIRSLEDANNYIQSGPREMYQRLGFGLWLVELKQTADSIGLCGLIKRDTLDDVDIGFAFLPEFWRQGYALESAAATISYARETLKLGRLVAITSQDNQASGKLLKKLGFRFKELIRLSPEEERIRLFVSDA